MEKKIFKVGDLVYSHEYGWGIVNYINKNIDDLFPIRVQFFSYIDDEFFTKNGTAKSCFARSLSFTEYTLQGFSQERPIELPEVGELCLFRNGNDEYWRGVEFKTYNKTLNCPFIDSNNDGWKQMKRIKILD